MGLYRLLLGMGAVLGSPWWGWRLLRSREERARLPERMGRVPVRLRDEAAGFRNVWLHAVSVGEVLAATRLVGELERGLEERWPTGGEDKPWRVVVSATTVAGQRLARERFGEERVFANPLDFKGAVRAYLEVLTPAALLLVEGELWPELLEQCGRRGVPVAVVNARVSDRSFRRTVPWAGLWRRWMGMKVGLWCAQGAETAERLRVLGVEARRVIETGNLKYDVRAVEASALVERMRIAAGGRPVVVCGSTMEGEEAMLLGEALPRVWAMRPETLVVLAPRHPQRFEEVYGLMEGKGIAVARVTTWGKSLDAHSLDVKIVLLDTIGDLAAVYGLAEAAFVGGSLEARGGHNPLEPAQWGVPVVMGPSEENFREVAGALRAAGGLLTGADAHQCGALLARLVGEEAFRRETGERARAVFEKQGGATARTVERVCGLLTGREVGR